jgi:hypothetical protein
MDDAKTDTVSRRRFYLGDGASAVQGEAKSKRWSHVQRVCGMLWLRCWRVIPNVEMHEPAAVALFLPNDHVFPVAGISRLPVARVHGAESPVIVENSAATLPIAAMSPDAEA